jgi:hypothetical protein
MKLVVTFLVLCFFLLGGYASAHAGAPDYKLSYSLISHIEKTGQVENRTINHRYLVSRDNGLGEGNTLIISVEDEDEDEDIVRKHVVPAKYLLAFYYTFFPIHSHNILSEPLSFCEHLSYVSSCKYLEQRVLRI